MILTYSFTTYLKAFNEFHYLSVDFFIFKMGLVLPPCSDSPRTINDMCEAQKSLIAHAWSLIKRGNDYFVINIVSLINTSSILYGTSHTDRHSIIGA